MRLTAVSACLRHLAKVVSVMPLRRQALATLTRFVNTENDLGLLLGCEIAASTHVTAASFLKTAAISLPTRQMSTSARGS